MGAKRAHLLDLGVGWRLSLKFRVVGRSSSFSVGMLPDTALGGGSSFSEGGGLDSFRGRFRLVVSGGADKMAAGWSTASGASMSDKSTDPSMGPIIPTKARLVSS